MRHVPTFPLRAGLFVLLALVHLAIPRLQAQRAAYDFNPGWRLSLGDEPAASSPAFDDAAWKQVTLPRAWNEDDAFRVAIDKHPTGIAWYRKSFVLPPGSEGKKVYLEFEGVRQGAEFFLNGKSIGLHEDGITGVGFDITEAAKAAPAVNVLAVRTDNAWDYRERATKGRYQWNDKNFNANYGGIPKTSASTSSTASTRRSRSGTASAPSASMSTPRTSISPPAPPPFTPTPRFATTTPPRAASATRSRSPTSPARCSPPSAPKNP